MHVPLGLAMTEVMAETGLPSIARNHHDFTWERERFTITAGAGLSGEAAFPSHPCRRWWHAGDQFHAAKATWRVDTDKLPRLSERLSISKRRRLSWMRCCREIFARKIGLRDDDILVLQPTRIVPRKGIEHAIELAPPIEGAENQAGAFASQAVTKAIRMRRLRCTSASRMPALTRLCGWTGSGRPEALTRAWQKVYTLFDIYPHADLVTYPSYYEGFGNAFLEAVYFRKPVVVNTLRRFYASRHRSARIQDNRDVHARHQRSR